MDDFSMIYDDWMTCDEVKIEKTFVAKEMVVLAQMKYPNKNSNEIDEKFDFMYDKSLAIHQKLAMMMYAKSKVSEIKCNFESTQNMEIPTLYGMSKTMILFYFESMIVFARNALDVASFVYSDLFFDQRMDSFNRFIKKVKRSNDPMLEELKQFYNNYEENKMSALRLLCGSENGRALRDIIVHQANVRMEYYEYKENSEKEHLFLEVKGIEPFDLDYFVSYFTEEVVDILGKTNECCKKKLMIND